MKFVDFVQIIVVVVAFVQLATLLRTKNHVIAAIIVVNVALAKIAQNVVIQSLTMKLVVFVCCAKIAVSVANAANATKNSKLRKCASNLMMFVASVANVINVAFVRNADLNLFAENVAAAPAVVLVKSIRES